MIVTCYQEGSRPEPGGFDDCLCTHDDVSFVFVDDGSTDATAAIIIEDAVNRHPMRIAGIRNETNMGKGESVRQGVIFAADKADYLGYWDARLDRRRQLAVEGDGRPSNGRQPGEDLLSVPAAAKLARHVHLPQVHFDLFAPEYHPGAGVGLGQAFALLDLRFEAPL